MHFAKQLLLDLLVYHNTINGINNILCGSLYVLLKKFSINLIDVCSLLCSHGSMRRQAVSLRLRT